MKKNILFRLGLLILNLPFLALGVYFGVLTIHPLSVLLNIDGWFYAGIMGLAGVLVGSASLRILTRKLVQVFDDKILDLATIFRTLVSAKSG